MDEEKRIEQEKLLAEQVQAFAKQSEDYFNTNKLEEDEEIEKMIATEKSSIILSSKRVYFQGMKLNKKETADTVVNISDITNVTVVKRYITPEALKSLRNTLIITVLLIIFFFISKKNWDIVSDDYEVRKIGYNFFNLLLHTHGKIKMILFGHVLTTLVLIAIEVLTVYKMYTKVVASAYNYMTFTYSGKKQGALVRDNSLLGQIKEFVALQQGLTPTHQQQSQVTQSEISNTSTVQVESTKEKSKLERLNELTDIYNQGALNEEEFKQLKSEIITSK